MSILSKSFKVLYEVLMIIRKSPYLTLIAPFHGYIDPLRFAKSKKNGFSLCCSLTYL